MKNDFRRIRIFLASPSDVAKEREMLAGIVEDMNLTLGAEKSVFFELVKWESHTFPDIGEDAQDVINRQITDYDIFLGIMWQRFGTPTKRADSGTKEEFDTALNMYLKFSKPIIMFYFKTTPTHQTTINQVDQMRRVLEFKEELKKKGVYFREYDDENHFLRLVRNHLTMHGIKMLQYDSTMQKASNADPKHSESFAPSPAIDLSGLETQVLRLSSLMEHVIEEQKLTLRDALSSVRILGTRYIASDILKQELERERNSLRLMGISLGDFFLDRGFLHSLFLELLSSNRGLSVQALLLNPRSEALRQRARFEVGDDYYSEPAFFDSTTFIEADGALRIGSRICQQFKGVSLRCYELTPLCFLIMTSRRAFIEPYHYAGRGGNGVLMTASSDDPLYEIYTAHFSRVWNLSVDAERYKLFK